MKSAVPTQTRFGEPVALVNNASVLAETDRSSSALPEPYGGSIKPPGLSGEPGGDGPLALP
jgi:hypothetical protein